MKTYCSSIIFLATNLAFQVTEARFTHKAAKVSSFVSPATNTNSNSQNYLLKQYPNHNIQKVVTSSSSSSSSTKLYARPKKIAGTKGGKIQVKLLKTIPGTGNQGDVILVTPAFFENKLRKTNSAKKITDEEVKTENKEKQEKEKARMNNATDVAQKLQDFELVISKNAGPNGHLFGGVKSRDIMSELKKHFPKGALDGKQVKVTAVKTKDGKKVGNDIKEVGEYEAQISLLKGVSSKVSVSVVAE